MVSRYLFAVLLVLSVEGCAARRNERVMQTLRSRASFDMNCPQEQLQITEISRSAGSMVNSAGVRGCGHQAVYVRANNHTNWVLDATSGGEAED